MEPEQVIADIERLERTYALPDPRPLQPRDVDAANHFHDQRLAHSPWFRLWRDFGLCCRPKAEPEF